MLIAIISGKVLVVGVQDCLLGQLDVLPKRYIGLDIIDVVVDR